MKHELELKLQAWVDGQLPVHEADEMARLIETDAVARALLTELKHTRAALASHEETVKLPESREFYWSKISREIERQQRTAERRSPEISWMQHFRRLLIPVGAAAALLIFGTFASRHTLPGASGFELSGIESDADTFVFTDEESGTTLVWFSYGENELADGGDSNKL